MATTLHDIARRLNVSVQSVSAALHSGPTTTRLSPELRQRVVSAAREMGYQPNRLARGLVQGRSRLLGLLIAGNNWPLFVDAANGVEQEAAAAGYGLLLCNTRAHPDREKLHLQMLAENRVEGIISIASSWVGGEAEVLAHKPAGVPLVSINRQIQHPDAVNILMKNRQAARDVTELLIRQGHRRIAYLDTASSPQQNQAILQSSVDRREGYAEVMREAGLEPLVTSGSMEGHGERVLSAQRQAEALLAGPQPPTAFFGVADYEALGALHACRSLGRRVPDDVALFGFDDQEIGRWSIPALSTVRQPFFAAGRLAVRQLLERAESAHSETIYLDCSLVLRQSTEGPHGADAEDPRGGVPTSDGNERKV